YTFDVNATAGLEFRATLSWIDPPATAFSSVQLVHDLDLSVYGPTGLRYTMWTSGMVDAVNNNERVIISGDGGGDVISTWTVRVWSKQLAGNETQSYSLVVTGAI
ncbi:unnamed protein product, partial [Scytosiphon promiscuus]